MPESESQHSGSSPGAIETPACPKCKGSMMLLRIRPGRLNFDARTFECVKCSHVEKILVASDPMQSDVLGWLLGELRAPI
jgi:ssDNA-binding Zn-finger/Zn-ribbon topoisomerase 1